MSEDDKEPTHDKPRWLERLSNFLLREPEDREQLIDLLHSAYENNLLDADALSMIEGVLQVSEMQVRDVMIPRSQMDVIDITDPPEKFIPHVIETAHSRFPVIEENKDNVIGILLAKDLLRYYAGEDFEVRDMLRPAVFIPESKRLNVLLKEFRSNRNHIAIVVDEYGGVAGMVTIEDVLEQIVGEIEDEYDEDAEKTIFQTGGNSWRAMGITEIETFNKTFDTNLPDDDYDTVGGWLAAELGRIPRRGDSISHAGLNITVVGADARRALWLHIQLESPAETTPVPANE